MSLDAKVSVGDAAPVVQLVTYPDPPEPQPTVTDATAAPEGTSPTQAAQEATLETTGSDPPPPCE